MAFRDQLLKSWQQANVLTLALWPLTWLYATVFYIRKKCYQFDLFERFKAPVPVIVVGNLTVGGTGKTPLVIHLVEVLRANGFQPGVISRGYSGNAEQYPLFVNNETPVSESGDEPALIVRRTGVPMTVGSNRRASIELLLSSAKVDVIISDDGLQHLALQRDIEVCLMDETTGSTNTALLPAGPYREPLARLKSVDLIVKHQNHLSAQSGLGDKSFSMSLKAGEPLPVRKASNEIGQSFDAKSAIHAVAGIGNPQRFFSTCEKIGLDFQEHSYPDHYQFKESDFEFLDGKAILMTEKDAVKCTNFSNEKLWYLPVDAQLSDGFTDSLITLLNTK